MPVCLAPHPPGTYSSVQEELVLGEVKRPKQPSHHADGRLKEIDVAVLGRLHAPRHPLPSLPPLLLQPHQPESVQRVHQRQPQAKPLVAGPGD